MRREIAGARVSRDAGLLKTTNLIFSLHEAPNLVFTMSLLLMVSAAVVVKLVTTTALASTSAAVVGRACCCPELIQNAG